MPAIFCLPFLCRTSTLAVMRWKCEERDLAIPGSPLSPWAIVLLSEPDPSGCCCCFLLSCSYRARLFWWLKTLISPVSFTHGSLHLKTEILNLVKRFGLYYMKYFSLSSHGKALLYFSVKQQYDFDFCQAKPMALTCGSGETIVLHGPCSVLAVVGSCSPCGPGWQGRPQRATCLAWSSQSTTGIPGLINPTPPTLLL